MRKDIPLLGAQATARIAKVKDQQTINWRPRVETADAYSQLTLQYTAGLDLVTTIGTGPCRANLVKFGSYIYGVSGNTFYRLDTSGVATSIGTLNTTAGWCVMVAGRTYIAVVDGTNGYTYDGTTFAQIADADFPNGTTHIAYLDSYFVVQSPGTDQFFISGTEDPTAWDPLDFASAEANPDDITAVGATQKDLYLFGVDTTQVFYNSGNPTFPFDPYPTVSEYGIRAPYSLARNESGFYFLAKLPSDALTIVRMTGFQATPIINQDEVATINALTTTTDAIGSIYNEDGIDYYVINFPSEDLTFEVNTQTGLMHRMKSYGIGRSLRLGYGTLSTVRYCGDYNSAKIYKLNLSTYTENGGVIERYRRSQVIHYNSQKIVYHEIRLEVESGVGNATENNPLIQLRYSDDDGRSWSSWLDASMGAVGEYYQKLSWRRLGWSYGRVFEFRMTDPNKATILNATADVEVLAD